MKIVDTRNVLLRILIIFFLSSIVLQSCKETPFTPTGWEYTELKESLETQNFIFHFSKGDYVQTSRQEAFHEWATGRLGVKIPKKINYFKYKDKGHMKVMTGKATNGWADPENFAVHTIWPWDNHECVHCYTFLIGRPSDFFNEGIAVAFSTDPYNSDYEAKWWSESVHYWAKKYKDEGTLILLDSILESNAFRSYDSEKTYPESGSFVAFMIDNYGLDKMLSIFRTGSRMDSKEVIKQNFQSIYGFSIADAEELWQKFLDNF